MVLGGVVVCIWMWVGLKVMVVVKEFLGMIMVEGYSCN